MKTIKLAYIGGGSKQWARVFMSDLALQDQIDGEIALYDIDYEAALANQQIGKRINELPNTITKWEYHVYPTIEGALRDSDFIIISILPGTFQDMKSDVHTPEQYHIYQPVGDSTGPGGVLRSMRTVPAFEYIAKKIAIIAPNAWVINFTNPMSICVKTLYDVFPDIKAFGCCHEVFNAQRFLGTMYGVMKQTVPCERHDIKTEISGINHFTWITKATYKDIDLLKLLKEFMQDHFEEGITVDGSTDKYLTDYFACANRVKMDLFQRFNALGAAGDRHLVEFMNPDRYLRDLKTIDHWKFALTPVDYRIERQKERIKDTKKMANGQIPIEIKKSHEEAVDLMMAILGLKDIVSNVNMPNCGQTPDFPLGSIVETNCVFSKDSVSPLQAPSLPIEVTKMVLTNINNNELLYQGIKQRDLNLIFEAFYHQPLCVNLSRDEAIKLFNDMIKNTSNALIDYYPVLRVE